MDGERQGDMGGIHTTDRAWRKTDCQKMGRLQYHSEVI